MRKIWKRIGLTIALLPFVVFGVALAWPPIHPGHSVLDVKGAGLSMSMQGLPPVSRFRTRDGAMLAYRAYAGKPGGGLAVLIHGSSGNGKEMHMLAVSLAREGVTVLSPDLRGHGENRPHGDIAYIGQLEDDLADLVETAAPALRGERRVLIGHSSGGGFVLRVAGGPAACHFDSFLALAPYLNYEAPTARPGNGGWSSVSMPRIFALTFLEKSHHPMLQGLPVLAFAVPPGSEHELTGAYSYRMMRNFGLDFLDWKTPFAHIDRPTSVMVGSRDELFYADRFASTFHDLNPAITSRVLDGPTHMTIVTDANALHAETAEAKRLLAGPAAQRCAQASSSTSQ